MRPPPGTFKGQNFMTPKVLGWYSLPDDVWVELSTGRGIDGEALYGVTVRRAGGEPTPGSRMVYSKARAYEYIRSLGGLP